MTKGDIREGEVGSWAMGKMGDDQRVWYATMLVQNDQVGNAIGATRFRQLLDDIIPSI